MTTTETVHTASPARRWQGIPFHPHETQRLAELDGTLLASFGRRAGALAIDFVAIVAFFAPVAYLIGRAWSKAYQQNVMIDFKPFENWYSTITPVIYFCLIVWLTNGRTLGKWLTGIRIVSLTSQRISFWHSLERALGYGASLLEAGSGFFQYLTHPNRQTVHDRIAETIVVRLQR